MRGSIQSIKVTCLNRDDICHDLHPSQGVKGHRYTDNYYEVSHPFLSLITPIPTSIPTTWLDYVKSVSAWEQQILTDVTMDITALWTHLVTRDQEWIATSDGSFKNNTGAYAWLLHDGQRTIITGTGIVTGNPVTPFRTEYQGFMAIYCCIYHVSIYHDNYGLPETKKFIRTMMRTQQWTTS